MQCLDAYHRIAEVTIVISLTKVVNTRALRRALCPP